MIRLDQKHKRRAGQRVCFSISFFFTLYIQNSILQWVKGTFLQNYFRHRINHLTSSRPALPLDNILNINFSPTQSPRKVPASKNKARRFQRASQMVRLLPTGLVRKLHQQPNPQEVFAKQVQHLGHSALDRLSRAVQKIRCLVIAMLLQEHPRDQLLIPIF